MAENRFPNLSGSGMNRETVCIETNRVLDSCRDRDCFENSRVYLSDFGSEVLEHASAIRATDAQVLWCNISVDPIQFNRGFYAVTLRFFIKLTCEACTGARSPQEIEGLTVLEKRVILFGGEAGTTTFRSTGEGTFCSGGDSALGNRNLPTAVVELVDPVILGTKIMEKCDPHPSCPCTEGEIPESIALSMDAPIRFDNDNQRRFLTVSLGLFSVIRITRPAQYLVSAAEYAIPEKECRPSEDEDPCDIFRSMPFPAGEFSSQGFASPTPERRCGCSGNS